MLCAMRLRKYKGWMRLGVVLSTLWIIGASVTIGMLYSKITDEFFTDAWTTQDSSGWAVVGMQSFLFKCEAQRLSEPAATIEEFKSNANPQCNLINQNAAIVLLLPVICVWILIPLGVKLFFWIRDGFR